MSPIHLLRNAPSAYAEPRALASSQPKKNESIQVLRAIAALLVVHIHCLFIARLYFAQRHNDFFHIGGFGACGVDIFFAISGFILSTVAGSTSVAKPGGRDLPHTAWDFLIRRFLRIFPIYWVLSLFFVLVGLKQHHLHLSSVVNSYLLLPSLHFPIAVPLIFVGWTLLFEMFFYYLLTLNLFFGKRRVVERTIATICALIALGAVAGFRRPILILIANPMNLEFVFGCVIGLAYARFGKRQRLGTALLSAGAFLLLLTIFVGKADLGNADYILNGALSWYRVTVWGIPAAMITAGLAFRSTPIRSAVGRLGVELGNASYSIYLISLIVLYLYARVYPLLARLGAGANVAISFLAVVLAGELCYLCIEKPMTQRLTRKYRHPAVQSAP